MMFNSIAPVIQHIRAERIRESARYAKVVKSSGATVD